MFGCVIIYLGKRAEDMLDAIKSILYRHISSDISICEDSLLFEDLGLDSLEMFLVLCDLEENANIKVDLAKLSMAKTVADFIHCVSDDGEMKDESEDVAL